MPASTYVALGSITLSSAQAQITFSNIPQTYTDLILVSNIGTASINPSIYMRFNGDSQSNYSFTNIYGNGTSAASTRGSTQSKAVMAWYVSPNTAIEMVNITQIMNYSSNTVYKTTMSRANRGSASNSQGTEASISLWRKTDAINSITLLPEYNFSIGCTFSLYGIGAKELKATGGDIITTDGTYWYHAFKTSGTFTPKSTLSCDVLVVAGGGGGRRYSGAGAGGVYYSAGNSLSSSQTVTIGAGGVGNNETGPTITNGSNSVFGSLTAAVGGGAGGESAGGGANGANGIAGGSGGGGGYNGNGGAGTSGQGNAGGAGANNGTSYSGGSGGGAGASPSASTATASAAGGAGTNTYSSWLSTTGLGVSGYIAGGGSGGTYRNADTVGLGGSGGAGAGAKFASGGPISVAGSAAIANTGSGGGGSYNGGSGLVIVRYAV